MSSRHPITKREVERLERLLARATSTNYVAMTANEVAAFRKALDVLRPPASRDEGERVPGDTAAVAAMV